MAQCKAAFTEGRETFDCTLEEGHANEHRIICPFCSGRGDQPRYNDDPNKVDVAPEHVGYGSLDHDEDLGELVR